MATSCMLKSITNNIFKIKVEKVEIDEIELGKDQNVQSIPAVEKKLERENIEEDIKQLREILYKKIWRAWWMGISQQFQIGLQYTKRKYFVSRYNSATTTR